MNTEKKAVASAICRLAQAAVVSSSSAVSAAYHLNERPLQTVTRADSLNE